MCICWYFLCKSPRMQAAGAARWVGFTARAMYNVHEVDVGACSFVEKYNPWGIQAIDPSDVPRVCRYGLISSFFSTLPENATFPLTTSAGVCMTPYCAILLKSRTCSISTGRPDSAKAFLVSVSNSSHFAQPEPRILTAQSFSIVSFFLLKPNITRPPKIFTRITIERY